MDGRVSERLKGLLSQLHYSLFLLDQHGKDQLSDRSFSQKDIPFSIPDDRITRRNGYAFLPCQVMNDLLWMSTVPDDDSAMDFFTVAEALLKTSLKDENAFSEQDESLRSILTNPLDSWELDEAAVAYGIERVLRRSVLLMETEEFYHGNLTETLKTSIPARESDILVPLDRHSAAYIVDLSNMDEWEDLLEYANAIQESMMSEAGCSLRIGVGGLASDLSGLHHSYEQARQALKLGQVFLPQQSVWDYQRMLLPRFLSELSPQVAAKYHYSLFNADTAKLFTDEILETIAMFFDKDLNLSDTARQLYIHRNTLTYRLDKIEKWTGLDLRHFSDAVTFKMLLELKKCIPPQVAVD